MGQLTVLAESGAGSAAASEREREAIARDLANAVEGEVRFGRHDRMLYATDASLYQVEPIGVVVPANIEDAAAAVAFCAQRGLAMLPRGGGTSLAGQCTNRAVVIDFSPNCRRVLEIDGAGRRVRVEPGVTIDDLNDRLAPTGLFFAPDPATSKHCNIGGAIGNNAAGARSIKYGRTSENLRAVDVVLADGTRARLERGAAGKDPRVKELTRAVGEIVRGHAGLIRERFPKTIRRNAGYNLDLILAQLEGGGGPGARTGAVAQGGGVDTGGTPVPLAPVVPPGGLENVNLAHLVCGSEGTLAVTLGADLILHPLPKARGLAVLSFTSLDAAIEAVLPILATGPTAVELLDEMVIGLARANVEYRRYVDLLPTPASGELRAALYVEYFAYDDRRELEEQFAALRKVVPGVAMVGHTDAGAMLSAWKLRKAGEPLLHGVPGRRKPVTFVEDNAVPVENLATFVREFRKIVEKHGTRAAYWAHASVGVLHVRPMLDLHDAADRERMVAIAVEVADLAKRLGGVMSGEHGDGRVRTPLLERFYGRELLGAMREVKRAFDPANLLNPGNIVDLTGENPRPIQSMIWNLRIDGGDTDQRAATHGPVPGVTPEARPAGRWHGVDTYFDYSDEHGFDAAVEMCNGAGVCRKKQGGTMCPSYMALLDERHSTRGRGNALRLAITGQFDGVRREPTWDDSETIQTLNLCLSCKACKTECPSNVDIARLKAEYTAQRYRNGGVPLSARVFGSVRMLNRLGSTSPGIANWVNRRAITKWLLEKTLGIDRRRSMPVFARSLVKQWGSGGSGGRVVGGVDTGGTPVPLEPVGQGTAPVVVLFGDCFTMYNEPRIGMAARRVLEAFGYRVELADAGCCGRAKISTGLLRQAIEEADATLDRLRPWIEDEGVKAILVAEPSCLSAFKDDWLGLKLRTPIELRRRLAAKAMLVEQFLEVNWASHPACPQFARTTGKILLHGHCHQKALWGIESSAALLRRLAGDGLTVPDSGCCGMAGSFGFTTDRYDLSMKIGELELLPAVRAAGRGAIVVAPGTSCRHQIHDGAGVRALHPIELIDGLMVAGGSTGR